MLEKAKGKKTFIWNWIVIVLSSLAGILGTIGQTPDHYNIPVTWVAAILAAKSGIDAFLRKVTTDPPAQHKALNASYIVGLIMAVVLAVLAGLNMKI